MTAGKTAFLEVSKNRDMKKKKIILRIFVCPFVFGLFVCTGLYNSFRNLYLFMVHGGEFITYVEGDENKIYGIYQKLIESETDQ